MYRKNLCIDEKNGMRGRMLLCQGGYEGGGFLFLMKPFNGSVP